MSASEDAATDVAVSAADRSAIMAAATDYIEAWLDGDAGRMSRCLHPELVKREVAHGRSPMETTVDTIGRDDMVDATRAGYGTAYERPYDVSLLDAFGDIATVRVFSSVYMDYLHVARFGDRWLLVNVLWQRRPGR